MKVTKIKQEMGYDVIAANAHQVKTAPLFHKLPTTGKDIMLTLVTHRNVILFKKRLCVFIIYLSIFHGDVSRGNDIPMDKPGYNT